MPRRSACSRGPARSGPRFMDAISWAQNWGFTDEANANNPAEELVQVSEGDDIGWPYCYYSNDAKRKVLAPEYGGDGKSVGRCATAKAPAIAFPGHWAPMALQFYPGTELGAAYAGGLFVTFHGSWNRAPLPQEGYRVVFAPFANTTRYPSCGSGARFQLPWKVTNSPPAYAAPTRCRIELQRHRRPVAGERDRRRLGPRAAADLLAVAAVLGREHLPLRVVAVVAVGPADVVALRDLHQLLGGIVRVGLVAEAPVLRQLIAPVNRGPHRACPGCTPSASAFRSPVAQRRPSPNVWPARPAANRQMPARRSSSVHGSRPGTCAARFDCWQLLVAEPIFTSSTSPPGKAIVLASWSPPAGSPVMIVSGSPAGSSLPRGETPPDDAPLEREVEIPVVHGDVVAAAGTERRALVHGAVAVPVAERRHPAAKQAAARRGVEVAAGPDGQVPHVVDVARHDAGAESVGKAEPAVVGRTRRRGPSRGEAARATSGITASAARSAGSADERHETTPFLRPASGEPRAPGARFQDSHGPEADAARTRGQRVRGHSPRGGGLVSEGKRGSKSGFPREKRAENPVFRGKTAISLL